MAKKRYWVKEAFSKNKGALHHELGIPQGKKIPASKLNKAAKKGGVTGKRARLAKIAKSFKHKGSKKKR